MNENRLTPGDPRNQMVVFPFDVEANKLDDRYSIG